MEAAPKKKYLYHKVPEDLKGNIIYPLNELKNIHPDLYLSKSAKYKGRERLMEELIHNLECKWNDVLFLSPVSPEDLKKALNEAGFFPKEMKFFQIDPELLEKEKTSIFLFKESDIKHKEDDYKEFNLNDLEKYSIINQKTKDYFKERREISTKEGIAHYMTFAFIPHILHKGPIDISDLPVITV